MNELSAIAAGLASDSAGRLALVAEDAELSFAELGARVAARARDLARRGVARGSRVALVASNRAETVIAILALLELGAVLVPIHPRFTPSEVDALCVDVAPALTLSDADLEPLEPLLRALPPPQSEGSEPLAILYTSGTSGRPKGAILSRRAFLASARASEANLGVRDEDRWLLCMPLCHVGGLSIVTRCLVARRAVVLEPRFEPRAVLASIERHRVTQLSVVPTMLRALLDADARAVLATLRVVLVGGAAVPLSWLEECVRRGVPALATYGLTEACSQVSAQAPGPRAHADAGSGRALDGVDLRIVSDARTSLPPGEIGRIEVRGPTVTSGYHGLASPLVDGWLDTGDLGALDARGVLFVHGRRTDLVVTGGENVYPAELEQVLESIAGVARALVFGVPDERWGEVVAAAIVLAPGRALDEGALASELALRLAPHKRPRRLALVDELPVTAAGKPDRRGAALRLAGELRPFAYASRS